VTEQALVVDNLRFSYRHGPQVLDVPRLELARGERVFLHGPSGSGKTTLLGIIAGILAPTAGSVQVLGHEFATLPGAKRDAVRGAHLGYIFQMFNLIPYLDVLGNITLPCRLNAARAARLAGKADTEVARELAQRLKIDHLLGKPVTELSVGQQQRVAAARALIGAPELVIADEPTSALDADHREAFLTVLFDEAKRVGASVLFVSHDHGLASLFPRVWPLRELNRVAQPH
jgi:putative ABC transport system ATP-binding protein